jgi:hypothetical protein
MSVLRRATPLALAVALALAGCGAGPQAFDRVLVLALSVFPPGADGKPSNDPGAATLVLLRFEDGAWTHELLQDPESNVFHKALAYTPPGGAPGLLTIAGDGARLKLWRRQGGAWQAETLWAPKFGGEHDRLRDVEFADTNGDGVDEALLATHDQGVVAIADFTRTPLVQEIDRAAQTFVHEVEAGDVDGDGKPEFFTTPSEPNRLDGTPQSGHVMRYRPGATPIGEVFADLGDRHAKEILVHDFDGDGRPEVYVAVEGRMEQGRLTQEVEIRRYTEPGRAGAVIARIRDSLCRVLVAADVDGDGRRELVAAPFKAGLWLYRPRAEGEWDATEIDADSSSFEHAVGAFDLDGDGADELYVAADDQKALRRYRLSGERFEREEIFRYPPELRGFTWNVTAVPRSLTR